MQSCRRVQESPKEVVPRTEPCWGTLGPSFQVRLQRLGPALLSPAEALAQNHHVLTSPNVDGGAAGNEMSGPNDACFEEGAQCLAQRLLSGDGDAHLAPKLSPIKTGATGQGRNASDAGAGATSGHSDTTYQNLLPASATATAADAHASLLAVQACEPASPDSVVTAPKPSAAAAAGSPASAAPQVPDLVPLPPPDASEGPEAAAEYELYLQRWDAGDTLAQRWHR
jgi:hypothetical protein